MQLNIRLAMAIALLAPASKGDFVYVANALSNNISGYRIETVSGQLSPIGSFPAGDYPATLAAEPSGRFLYVANCGSGIWTYRINQATGALTKIGEAARPVGDKGVCSIAPDASGKFVYAVYYGTGLFLAFQIDQATGLLTPIGSSPGSLSGTSIGVDPKSRFAYTANDYRGGVSAFSLDPSTGSPTLVGTFPVGIFAKAIAIEPSGQFAYVSDQASNGVFGFRINQQTGALTSLGPVIPSGGCPGDLTAHPNGRVLYVLNPCTQNISVFSIDPSSGNLTSIGSAVSSGSWPTSLAVNFHSTIAYVANTLSENVSTYAIAPNGNLSSLGQLMPTGAQPLSLAISACVQPPIISGLTADPAILWPPDRKMVNVTVGYTAASDCGAPVCILDVKSNRPDPGSSDWVVLGPHAVLLRAERNGTDADRIYSITVSCNDGQGNTASKSVGVVVPHDRRD